MQYPMKIAVIVGSLRKESSNLKLAQLIVGLRTERLELEIIEIGKLPFYNQDLDGNPPREWTYFRDRMRPFIAVLFVTPEYNRSIPSVLKNALDVGSFPPENNIWTGKFAAIASVSRGHFAEWNLNEHLSQCLSHLAVPVYRKHTIKLGDNLFDANGKLADAGTQRLIETFLTSFGEWLAAKLG